MANNNTYGSFAVPVPLDEATPVYQLTRTGWDQSDASLLATIDNPTDNSIAVITTVIDAVTYDKIAYIYSDESTKWEPMTGQVEASKIVLKEDIKCAGNYSQVGNITKPHTGVTTLSAKGKTVAELLNEIFSKRVQPEVMAPSVSNITLSPVSGLVEAGTQLNSIIGKGAEFDPGRYTFGPATAVTVTSRELERICTPSQMSADSLAVNTDDGAFNDATRITIGDQGGDYVAETVSYRQTIHYSEGATAKDNLGDDSAPAVKISAGEVSAVSDEIRCYRKYFIGTAAEVPSAIDSDFIRTLTGSAKALEAGETVELNVTSGAQLVVIAYPSSLPDLESIRDANALWLNILTVFEKTTVNVSGANNYTAVPYKVYTYKPDLALAADTYAVTVGLE